MSLQLPDFALREFETLLETRGNRFFNLGSFHGELVFEFARDFVKIVHHLLIVFTEFTADDLADELFGDLKPVRVLSLEVSDDFVTLLNRQWLWGLDDRLGLFITFRIRWSVLQQIPQKRHLLQVGSPPLALLVITLVRWRKKPLPLISSQHSGRTSEYLLRVPRLHHHMSRQKRRRLHEAWVRGSRTRHVSRMHVSWVHRLHHPWHPRHRKNGLVNSNRMWHRMLLHASESLKGLCTHEVTTLFIGRSGGTLVLGMVLAGVRKHCYAVECVSCSSFLYGLNTKS